MGIFSLRRNDKEPDDFWREYEEKTGETIIARSLGQYISGWDEFGDVSDRNPIWGLIIATSGGFRFHHFPQTNWLSALIGSGGEAQKEKTIFIPREKIIAASLSRETKWYRKILSSGGGGPRLLIRYLCETGTEKALLFNAEYKSENIVEAISPQSPVPSPQSL
jgi:hypothetical protein